MKRLLSLLSVLTITGTSLPITIAVSSYKKENFKLEKSNLKNLVRKKRQNNNIQLSSIGNLVLNLGRVRPDTESDSRSYLYSSADRAILNRFINLNRSVLSNVSVDINNFDIRGRGSTWAQISLRGQSNYVLVTFSLPTIRSCESNIQAGSNQQSVNLPNCNWSRRINLSSFTNINRNLGTILNSNEQTIIHAFMFVNQNLSNDLVNILRVTNIRNNRATIFVPEGNVGYEGNIIVFFNLQQNTFTAFGDFGSI